MEHIQDISENKIQSVSASLNEKPIQKKGRVLEDNRPASILQRKANNTGLPDNLKSGIENLSGHSMDDVKVHYNSDKPAQLNAHAYAQGSDIHIASGQEKHLPHEAWHVVQQKQGRVKPTLQMKGKVNVNDDKGLENEADVMGSKALQMKKTTSELKHVKVNSNISQLKIDLALFSQKLGRNKAKSQDSIGKLYRAIEEYNKDETSLKFAEILEIKRSLKNKHYKQFGTAIDWLGNKLESESIYLTTKDEKKPKEDGPGPISQKFKNQPLPQDTAIATGYETDSEEDHDSEYAGLTVKNKKWDDMAEFDGIDMTRGKMYEDKEAHGLNQDADKVDNWVKQHLYEEIIKKLNAIHENPEEGRVVAPKTQTKGGQPDYIVPSIEHLRKIKKVKCRVESNSPLLRQTISKYMIKLNEIYGHNIRFTFKMNAKKAKQDGPPAKIAAMIFE